MGALRPARPEPLVNILSARLAVWRRVWWDFPPAREIEISDCSF